MLNLLLTIAGMGAIVGLLLAVIERHLEEETKNEFHTNKWNDTLDK